MFTVTPKVRKRANTNVPFLDIWRREASGIIQAQPLVTGL